MKVSVASTNPVKVEAVRKAFSRFYSDAEIISCDTDSGVGSMPMSESETEKGAVQRAKAAALPGMDFSVGLEGGCDEKDSGMFLMGKVTVIDSLGNIGISTTGQMLLPEQIARKLREGKELGPLMDQLTGRESVKKKEGAVGHFTKNNISRTDSFEQAVVLALVRFINKEVYDA